MSALQVPVGLRPPIVTTIPYGIALITSTAVVLYVRITSTPIALSRKCPLQLQKSIKSIIRKKAVRFKVLFSVQGKNTASIVNFKSEFKWKVHFTSVLYVQYNPPPPLRLPP